MLCINYHNCHLYVCVTVSEKRDLIAQNDFLMLIGRFNLHYVMLKY